MRFAVDRTIVASEGQAEEVTAESLEDRCRKRLAGFVLPGADVVRLNGRGGIAIERDGGHMAAGFCDGETDGVILQDPGGKGVDGLEWRVCREGVPGEQVAGGHAGKERKPQDVLVSKHLAGRSGSVVSFQFGEPRTGVRGWGMPGRRGCGVSHRGTELRR